MDLLSAKDPDEAGMKSPGGRTVKIFAAVLFATMMMGCYDGGGWGGGGWGGGGYPDYYSGYGSPYQGYESNYYSNNVYRGYGGYSSPGLFGGYPPAHEAWDASARGRAAMVIPMLAVVPTNIAEVAEHISNRVDTLSADTAVDMVADTAEATDMATKRRRPQKTEMLQALPRDRGSMAVGLALRASWIMLIVALGSAPIAFAQEAGQRTFDSVTAATDAFAAAVRNHDETAMLAILGPSAKT